MDRFHCREAVLTKLKAEKRVGKIEKHTHSVGHCQRCNTIIEPYLSDQWFVKMKPLADQALSVLENGDPRIIPPRWTRVYASWLNDIRDWCISRQLWWGHRIPVWYCTRCGLEIVTRDDPAACPACGGAVEQDDDVLDTWFSSWLWPFSTLGWPDDTADLKRFYPTSLLVTGYDIIFFWVARMVMAGLEFTGAVPFRDVYFTGMVKDELGRWMSKSLGNGIDPIEMIEKYSADAVRFSLAVLTTEGQDIHLAPSKFEMGRNFSNKLWNAYRFLELNQAILPHVDDEAVMEIVRAGDADLSDRWILSREYSAIDDVTTHLESLKFSDGALTVYTFLWRDFCDWYVELIKSRLVGNASAGAAAKVIASHVLSVALRLLHPFMPFITEELWQRCFPSRGTLALSRWPLAQATFRDLQAESDMDSLQGVIRVVRNIRGEMNVPPSKQASLTVRTNNPQLQSSLERNLRYVQELGKVRDLMITPSFQKSGAMAAGVVGDSEVFMPLDGLVDISAERSRLGKELERTERVLVRSVQKLNNPDFLDKAPLHVVQGEREKADQLEDRRKKLLSFLESLS
jgi:valyl-tRNA synthetase